mgnify:CR=1 FL=1
MDVVELTARTHKLGKDSGYFGGSSLVGNLVAKGTCSFCNREVGFRQVGTYERGEQLGYAVPIRCDNCHAIMTISYSDDEATLYPTPEIEGVSDVPEDIEQYY